MSQMERCVSAHRKEQMHQLKHPVVNYMGGTSYRWNPVDTLKLVTASSIFGEPAYYRNGAFAEAGISKVSDGRFTVNSLFEAYLIPEMKIYLQKNTSQIMEEVIDAALDYDFAATLSWAVTLRREYHMRLNPQVIMVRAALHPKRNAFTEANPGVFAEINAQVMARADEPASQLTYYLYRNRSKNRIPGILKRSWSERIGSMNRYEVYKYRNSGIGMIDTIRICHAKGELIDELMRTGTVEIPAKEKTWETMRASGASWNEILNTIHMGHMALLRNLRGIFTEISDMEQTRRILNQLKKGVPGGKQFPYRYKSAYDAIKVASGICHRQMILDALEECIDIACGNMPTLPGRTVCLSDNSGSAWGCITSSYGSVRIAEIDNLSSVITAHNSEEGFVGKFGDRLQMYEISKRQGVLHQTEQINATGGRDVGHATENGIWLFFEQAIREKIVYDNIFIYSDQQAGHGGLFGTQESIRQYHEAGCCFQNFFVDVAKLIDTYRRTVNPRVNVFCVQTAGYDNVLIPENGYRTSILYGWTGSELVYADAINRFWDEKDAELTPTAQTN